MSSEEIPSAGEYQAAMAEMDLENRTPSEIEYDRQLDRLDTLFSSLSPGVTLLIQRIQPSWCKGVLEEITIGDDEINLDYFIEQWGGHLLLVKVRGASGRIAGNYKIPLFSYPPMVYGKRLKYNDKSERFLDESETPTPNPVQSSPVVVTQNSSLEKIFQALPAVLPLISEMMRSSEARRQADMAMMMQMFKSQGNGLSDITKVGTVMSQLSEMFRHQSGDMGNGGGEMDFMGNALEVIKTVFNNKPDSNIRQEHKLVAPRVNSPPPSQSIAPPSKVVPIKSSVSIAQSISAMGPKEAADTIIEAILRMEPSKRNEAIGNFIAQYEADMGSGSEFDDGYDEELEEKRGR